MPDLNVDNLSLVLTFIVPGLLILSIRAQFLTGRRPSHSASLLSYLAISALYYALVVPVILLFIDPSHLTKATWGVIWVFVGPVLSGLLLGIERQQDGLHNLLRLCHLNPVHSMPTAWDWKFTKIRNVEWVLVTLKNGKRFAGRCDCQSFASSDPTERDIYLTSLRNIGEGSAWPLRGDKSVLITSGEISTIVFWPYDPEEETNDPEQQTER